jgi:hypothetical protein
MRFISAVEDAEHDIGNRFSKTYKAEGTRTYLPKNFRRWAPPCSLQPGKTIPSLLTAKYTGHLALLRPKSRGKQKQMKH